MCRGGHFEGRAVSGSGLGGAASPAGRFVPLIALLLSSLLLATARGADSSSHSLRHHGAHRPPEPGPHSSETNSSARNQLLFREGEDVFIPCDLTAASSNASASDEEDVQWYHDGTLVAVERPPHRPQSSGPTSEVLRSLGFGDMGAQVLGEGPAGAEGGGKFQWERVGPNKTRLRIRGAGRSEEGAWQCRKAVDASYPPPLEILMIEPPHTVYLSVEGRRVGAVGGARLEEEEGAEDEDEEEEEEEGVEVREDASITVRCVAEGGRPSPSLSWLLDDRLASHASTDLSSPHPSGIGIRVGSVARALHGARISCVARHPALPSTLTASLKLNVLYSPSFGISREPGFGFLIREGMPVSLKCDVDSNPPAAPLWRKDNGDPGVPQSGDDGFLNFTSISREHSGWYKCTTHHRFGLFSSIGYFLNVRYKADSGFPSPPVQTPEAGAAAAGKEEEEEPPTVHSAAPNDPLLPPNQQHQIVEVTLGGAVRLSCEGKDFSGPAPCWGRVEGEGTVDPLGEGSALALDRVLYGDAGVYACTPRRRKVGVEAEEEEARREEAKRTFRVVVSGRPVVYPANRTIKAAKGTRRLSFSVEFCAHPPHSAALWMFQPPPARLQPLRQEDAGEEEEGTEADDQRLHMLLPPPVHHHRGPLLLWPGDRDHSRGLIAHNVTSGGSNPSCYQSALTVREVSTETAGEYAFVVRSSEGVAQGLVHLEVNGVPSDGPYHPPPPPIYQPPSFPVASSLPSSGRALPKAPPSVPEKDPPPVKDSPSSSSSSPSLFPSSTSSASPSSPSLLLALLLLPLITSLLPTQSLTFSRKGSVFCTSHQL